MNTSEKILPLFFFPPVEFYFHLLNSEEIVFEVMETYSRQTYRNRNRIYTANGVIDISIPVNKPNGNHTLTKDIVISNDYDWKNKYWKAIETAYNSSPYLLYYKDELYESFIKQEDHLFKFNLSLIQIVCRMLDIELNYKLSEKYFKSYENGIDLRNNFNPKRKSNKLLYPEYFQVFSEKFGFMENLSIIDLLFNLGPEAGMYLKNCKTISDFH